MTSPCPPEVRCLLALQLVGGLGPRRLSGLLEHFGSPQAILAAPPERLAEVPLIGPKLAQEITRARQGNEADAEVARMEKAGVKLLMLGTPDYPAALATIPDPPHLLYLRGALTEADANAAAMVGSRHCTAYGRKMAGQLAGGLARAGYTIVSGLARGIDGVAHQAALDAGGRTLAVLANGLSRTYPPEHRQLAEHVVARGALLTESRMEEPPLKDLFPGRNRIISGLSRAVIIIEAAERSGTLITARHAAEQGRTVFAVPGPVDSPASAGTNALIREGAILCRGVEDVLEELVGVSALAQGRGTTGAAPPLPAQPPLGLDASQLRIWELLEEGPRSLDQLAQTLQLPVSSLSSTLLTLEMKKVVRRLPGSRFERCQPPAGG